MTSDRPKLTVKSPPRIRPAYLPEVIVEAPEPLRAKKGAKRSPSPPPRAEDSTRLPKVFEGQVRQTARLLWNREARQELINGVVYDVVIHLTSQRLVVVEATISTELRKIREDLTRLSMARLHMLMERHSIVEPYLVLRNDPSPDIIATANGLNIEVMSLRQIKGRLFDFTSYRSQRENNPFGSAVLSESGQQDRSEYTPVTYVGPTGNSDITIENICSRLVAHEQIVLVGEYGTGKSRCIQECFIRLSERADSAFCYPIAINLRDCWGLETADEIVSRHLRRMGLSDMIDRVLRLLGAGSVALLLDGFDELGTQSWSDEVARLQDLRARALRGTRDLIAVSKGGVLIAGREHYFDGNKEMLAALGLRAGATIISCKTEFTVPEMKVYLRDRRIDRQPPEWLPRRPLMVQILSSFDEQTLLDVISVKSGAVKFWSLFVRAFCEREAKAKDMLDADTIQLIMQRLARLTRAKPSDVGPLTQTEIKSAFEAILGTTAIEESRVILQRLSGLGRVSNETDDRRFVDTYLLDGFRALDTQSLLASGDRSVFSERWTNPLRSLGQQILGSTFGSSPKSIFTYAKHCATLGNAVLAGDIVAAAAASRSGAIDFGGLDIQEAYFLELNLHEIRPANLTLDRCVIHRFVAPRSFGEGFLLSDCDIELMYGELRLSPDYLRSCRVEFERSVSIPLDRLAPGHRALVRVLTSLLEARGKKGEVGTLRRLAAKELSTAAASQLIALLTTEEEIVHAMRGRTGLAPYFKMNKEAHHRVIHILRDLHLSTDSLWSKAGALT